MCPPFKLEVISTVNFLLNLMTIPSSQPHRNLTDISIDCAIITVSDTRIFDTDTSGKTIDLLLQAAGHRIISYRIIPDEPTQIQAELERAVALESGIQAIVFNGGTGISHRDTTHDAIASKLTKTLPGFGEIFRLLSYEEIGSRAMASRAIAGTYQHLLVFSLPGSSGAVKLGMEKLIIPELVHLVTQIQK
jgi:molybdopterin adenylyltransferase